ncbi:putative mitochondrial translational initiation factor [Operophtera brumata]|uniref:Putative mitochondrial translational initiation factor n=1 Tax=Operophtera brumata TaxID=104452 RepID=A0A0L7KSM5_OPEBR|nr:putative mitochondrial translational initiation factor [Operophtera brumata]
MVTDGKKKVPVAGCRCMKGALARNASYRVVREQEIVFEGKFMVTDGKKKVKPGDTIVCYKMVDAADRTAWDPGF